MIKLQHNIMNPYSQIFNLLYTRVNRRSFYWSGLMKNTKWICINAHDWKGTYSETIPVMHHGIDWQQCPICHAPEVPVCGSTGPSNTRMHAGAPKYEMCSEGDSCDECDNIKQCLAGGHQ